MLSPMRSSDPPMTAVGDKEVQGQRAGHRVVTSRGIHPEAQRLELVTNDDIRAGIEVIGCIDIAEGDTLPTVIDIDSPRPLFIAGENAEARLRDRGASRHTEGLFLKRICRLVGKTPLIYGKEGSGIQRDTAIDSEGHLLRLVGAQSYPRLSSRTWRRDQKGSTGDEKRSKCMILASMQYSHRRICSCLL